MRKAWNSYGQATLILDFFRPVKLRGRHLHRFPERQHPDHRQEYGGEADFMPSLLFLF